MRGVHRGVSLPHQSYEGCLCILTLTLFEVDIYTMVRQTSLTKNLGGQQHFFIY